MLMVIANWIVTRYGYVIVEQSPYDTAIGDVDDLRSYAYHSGHLARGFHAGKRVQDVLNIVHALLLESRWAKW